MFSTQDFRKGLKIEIDGEPYIIVEAIHVKPGKGVAFVKTKYKSLRDGRQLQKNFRSGDKVSQPDLEERDMQYLYLTGDGYVFMDNSTYEQIEIPTEQIEHILPFLKAEMNLTVLFYEGNALSVDLPNFVALAVAETGPGVKGDTAQGGTKPATLETGHSVLVPLYIEEGEVLRIDTRTGAYVERFKG
jgi:elongation factor P